MKKKLVTKQVNVRLPIESVNLLTKAADILEKSQVEVINEALQMYTRRKKVSLEGAKAS